MSTYHRKIWKKKREYILARDKYLDQIEIRYGKHLQANTVHHIFPIEFYPELKYVDWNLISLSKATHNRLHQRTSHNLTDEGLQLQNRFKRQYFKWCKENNTTPHFEN